MSALFRPLSIIFLLFIFLTAEVSADIRIVITGVDKSLQEKIHAAIALARQQDTDRATAARIKSLHTRSFDEIRRVLESNGYYNATIDGNLDNDGDDWNAKYEVHPGPPILISDMSLILEGEGRADPVLAAEVKAFPLMAGEQLSHALYETGKNRIINIARERGYFDARFTRHTIHLDRTANSAVIDLVFDSGPRYRFGEVKIPKTVIAVELLQMFIPIREGEPYDANLLISTSQSLRDSDYFNDVVVSADLDAISNHQVPVTISLSPKPANSYQVGLGFGTDTGPRLSGAWDSRYFNGQGHRIETDLSISPAISELSGSYLIPYFRNKPSELGIKTSLSREDTDTSTSDTFKFGVQHLRKRRSWNENLNLTYQLEKFDVADTSQTTGLLIPGISYWKTVSDNPVYTSNGYRISLDLRGSLAGLVSDISFIQAQARGKYIMSIGKRGRLITRVDVGATLVSHFAELPASMRFFAGGDNSIRGFDLETLGPKNAKGRVIGGKYLTVGSVEYEHRFLEKWSAAVFSDFGNAYDDFSEDFEYSVGTGLRWRSPVGQIRLDIGVALSEPDHPFRIHINVGPDL